MRQSLNEIKNVIEKHEYTIDKDSIKLEFLSSIKYVQKSKYTKSKEMNK